MAPELLGPGLAELLQAGTDPDLDQSTFVPTLTKETDIYGFSMVTLEVCFLLLLVVSSRI